METKKRFSLNVGSIICALILVLSLATSFLPVQVISLAALVVVMSIKEAVVLQKFFVFVYGAAEVFFYVRSILNCFDVPGFSLPTIAAVFVAVFFSLFYALAFIGIILALGKIETLNRIQHITAIGILIVFLTALVLPSSLVDAPLGRGFDSLFPLQGMIFCALLMIGPFRADVADFKRVLSECKSTFKSTLKIYLVILVIVVVFFYMVKGISTNQNNSPYDDDGKNSPYDDDGKNGPYIDGVYDDNGNGRTDPEDIYGDNWQDWMEYEADLYG